MKQTDKIHAAFNTNAHRMQQLADAMKVAHADIHCGLVAIDAMAEPRATATASEVERLIEAVHGDLERAVIRWNQLRSRMAELASAERKRLASASGMN